MSATQEIWRFFRRHRLNETTGIKSPDANVLPSWFSPNPATDVIHLAAAGATTISDLNGRIRLRTSGKDIDLRSLPAGTYVLQSGARSATIVKE